jgi:hypothetical protein
MRCNVDPAGGIRRSERDDADSESELRVLRTDKRRCASRSSEPATSFIDAVTAACASTLDDVERPRRPTPLSFVGFNASPLVNIHAAGVNCHVPGKLGREYLQVIAAAGRKPTTEGKRWTYTWI